MPTHAELCARRRAIADFVKQRGNTSEARREAARRFEVGMRHVQASCQEFGVVKTAMRPKTFSILADLLNTKASLKAIADRHDVSLEYVFTIYHRAQEAGIELYQRIQGKKSPVPSL